MLANNDHRRRQVIQQLPPDLIAVLHLKIKSMVHSEQITVAPATVRTLIEDATFLLSTYRKWLGNSLLNEFLAAAFQSEFALSWKSAREVVIAVAEALPSEPKTEWMVDTGSDTELLTFILVTILRHRNSDRLIEELGFGRSFITELSALVAGCGTDKNNSSVGVLGILRGQLGTTVMRVLTAIGERRAEMPQFLDHAAMRYLLVDAQSELKVMIEAEGYGPFFNRLIKIGASKRVSLKEGRAHFSIDAKGLHGEAIVKSLIHRQILVAIGDSVELDPQTLEITAETFVGQLPLQECQVFKSMKNWPDAYQAVYVRKLAESGNVNAFNEILQNLEFFPPAVIESLSVCAGGLHEAESRKAVELVAKNASDPWKRRSACKVVCSLAGSIEFGEFVRERATNDSSWLVREYCLSRLLQ